LSIETLEIFKYSLYVDDGFGVKFTKVYEGQTSYAVVHNLQPSVAYTFYVTASNFNGEGSPSDLV